MNIIKIKNNVVGYVFIGLCILLLAGFLFPYIYLVLSSFKPAKDVVSTDPSLFPEVWTLDNYRNAFKLLPLVKYFKNSFIASVTSTVLALSIGSVAAYSVSRLKGARYAGIFMVVALLTRIIPMISISIPMYGISLDLKLYDTVWILILFYTAFELPFVVWMMSGYFDGIPNEMEESALMDGCNILKALNKIILPMAKPGLAATAILAFIMPWNDFLFALFVTSKDAKTIPVGLSELITAYDINLAPMTAIAVFFSIPIIIATVILQKQIVSGMTLGAVKG